MIAYLVSLSICWSVCYLLYRLLLEKETFFQFNRVFLLGSFILGLMIPMFEVPAIWSSQAPLPELILPTITATEITLPALTVQAESNPAGFLPWIFYLYFAGVLLSGIRLGYGAWQLRKVYKKGEKIRKKDYTLVLTDSIHLPFSFLNLLFWSKDLELSPEDHHQIRRHEEAHIFQKHSLDILFIEILAVFLWFHPLVYAYRKSLRNVHEFLADDHVLQQTQPQVYGHLLLRQTTSGHHLALAHSFFPSPLKQRIKMMTKTKSKNRAQLKYLLALPIFLGLLIFCAAAYLPASHDNGEMPRFPGCETVSDKNERENCAQKKLFEFVFENVKYPEDAKKAGTEGLVVVQFEVDKDGSVINPSIARSLAPSIDAEAMRIVQLMPKWIPGKKDGKAVKTEFKLPIKFALDGSDKKATTDLLPIFANCAEAGKADEQTACTKKHLIQFIIDNMRYPEEAKKAGIEGQVLAHFKVDNTGKVSSITIKKSLSKECDQEVIRIINLMPRWTPPMKDGKPVATELTLPVNFAL